VFANPDATREADRVVFDDPIAHARFHFLDVIRRLNPAIVTDLRKIARVDRDDDDTALAAWSDRWHLPDPWCLDFAHAAISLYRRYDTGTETLCFVDPDRPGRWAGDPHPRALIVKPEHFDWLARHHLRPGFAAIAEPIGQPRQTVERACKRLAARIALTMRGDVPKGNPTIGKIGGERSKLARKARQQKRLLVSLGR
jgi:hypothetical protein